MAKAESSKAARIRSQADNHATARAKKVKHIGKTSAENVKVLQPEQEDEDGQSDEDEDEDDLDDLDLSDGTVNMDSSDDEAGGVDEFEGLDQQDQEESDDDLEDITNRKSAQTQSEWQRLFPIGVDWLNILREEAQSCFADSLCFHIDRVDCNRCEQVQ